jgi:hypothetical protein
MPLRTLIALCLLILALPALTGCGGMRRVVGAPTPSVQEVEKIGDRYIARLRLDSPASVPMVLKRLDWSFRPARGPEVKGSTLLELRLAPVAGDVVRIDLGSGAQLPALASLGRDDTLAYVFEAELHCSEPNVRFPLRYQGVLRPTPGKPDSFR